MSVGHAGELNFPTAKFINFLSGFPARHVFVGKRMQLAMSWLPVVPSAWATHCFQSVGQASSVKLKGPFRVKLRLHKVWLSNGLLMSTEPKGSYTFQMK